MAIKDLPFDHWRFTQFGLPDANNPAIAGFAANPDGDDLNNLEEYAYGTDPKLPGPSPIVMDTVVDGFFEFLRITVTRNPDATDVTFEVEACSDFTNPSNWSSAGLVTEIDTPTMLRVRDNFPILNGKRYMRVKITK